MEILEQPIVKHDIDWSKSSCGVMLCSFERTKVLMPEVAPILDELIPDLELPVEDYAVDVKVHMLMPDSYPCIPNWHRDFTPRDHHNKRLPFSKDDVGNKMYIWLSGEPLTEYIDENGNKFHKEAQKWHSFTRNDLHRGTISHIHTWRCFIRVIPKCFIHDITKNVGQIRRHCQVYLDSKHFTW